MGSSEGQTYCLRWNNHKSNLVEILDALIKMESYVDCTIVVDDQIKFKAHRVVLAANSPYFQSILQDYGSMDHCYLLFPGVQAFEMRALLEYMYTGEVNVTQSQIPKIMKIAEQLEVKGLFDMHDLKEKFNKIDDNSAIQNHSFNGPLPFNLQRPEIKETDIRNKENGNKYRQEQLEHHQSSPVITTSTNIMSAQSSSSPPYMYKSPYSSLYTKSPGPSTSERQKEYTRDHSRDRENREREREREQRERDRERDREREREQRERELRERELREREHREREHREREQRDREQREQQHTQQWPISPILPHSSIPSATAAAMLSSVYESAPDMNPLRRKKISSISSMLMCRDTPILRNVLAQTHAADSSQPMPLLLTQQTPQQLQLPPERSSNKLERSNSDKSSSSVNCSGLDFSAEKKFKYDEPHSPYTDKSFEDDGEVLQNFPSEFRSGSQTSSQKPEWKRYKQYTRNDILAAIECVRNGMSALQASRKFKVPSRTLYDKVKKLGITTGRPMNRTVKRSPSAGGSGSAAFPFGISGANPYSQSDMLSQYNEEKERSEREASHLQHNLHQHPGAAALLDPTFLQSFESRGGDIGRSEALHAMALAAVAHAAANGAISTSPGTNGTARSPSPGFSLKYPKHKHSPPPLHRDIQIKREYSDLERDNEIEREHDLDRGNDMSRKHDAHREKEYEYQRESSKNDIDTRYSTGNNPGPEIDDEDDDDDDDQVEDLSVGKPNSKESSKSPPTFSSPSGVIVSAKLPSPSEEFASNSMEAKRGILTDDASRD